MSRVATSVGRLTSEYRASHDPFFDDGRVQAIHDACSCEHAVLQSERIECVQRVGNQRIATDLVAREVVPIDESHRGSRSRELERRRGPGGAGADDERIKVHAALSSLPSAARRVRAVGYRS